MTSHAATTNVTNARNLYSLLQRWSDYIWTYAHMIAVTLGAILCYRYASTYLGQQGFAEYVLCRRFLAAWEPMVMLGLGVALTRQTALACRKNDGILDRSYVVAATLLAVLTAVISVLIANLYDELLAATFWGDGGLAYLVAPMSAMLFGLALNTICLSCLRGVMLFRAASVLGILTHAVIPVGAFWLGAVSVSGVLWTTGLCLCGCGLLFGGWILAISRPERSLHASSRELLSYGLPRMPGVYALSFLLAAPTFFAAHAASMSEAAIVGFGSAILTMAAAAFSPIGTVLLPRATQMIHDGRFDELRSHVLRLLMLLSGSTMLAIVAGEALAGIGTRVFLGGNFESYVWILQIMLFGILPYAVFTCLRGLINAAFKRAQNARNVFIAGGAYLIFAFSSYILLPGVAAQCVSFVASLYILAGLTLWDVRRILQMDHDFARADGVS